MFGTVFRMRPKQGQEKAVEAMMERWQRERRPNVSGVVCSHLFTSRSHPGEMIGVAVFDSAENYWENARDPEQDVWYQDLRALLQTDPDWNDGDVLTL